MAGQCSAGTFPRARQLDTTDWRTPSASANLPTPPFFSIAEFNASMPNIKHVRDCLVNINVIDSSETITSVKTIADRIRAVRKELKLSQAGLAKKAGVSQSTIGNLESGLRTDPRKLLGIASALNVSPEWLSTGRGHAANTTPGPDIRSQVPLISWVRAGEWSEAHNPHEPGYAEDWLPCLKQSGKHTYALRVRGDSMTAPFGKSYPDGCIIFVDPDKRSPGNGDRIIAKLKGSDEVTFKVFQQDAGRVWLKPLNPQHPAIMELFAVLGTIIGKWEDE